MEEPRQAQVNSTTAKPVIESSMIEGKVNESYGRIKAPPVCDDSILRQEAMGTSELKPHVFSRSALETYFPLDRSNGIHDLADEVILRTTSRQGRDTQRWLRDRGEDIRLVTGCVPILQDGMVLLVSASRKAEWILPKGGWEEDESIEQSALRETHEEAGVHGRLGPPLTEVTYETRKSKERRLDKARSELSGSTIVSLEGSTTSSEFALDNSTPADPQSEGQPPEGGTIIRGAKPPTYKFVRMTLFPLYVTEVREEWPESGRFRKLVHLDEAIENFAKRPEFLRILEEIKAKGLHLVREQDATVDTEI